MTKTSLVVSAKYSKLGYQILVGDREVMRRGNCKSSVAAVVSPTSRYAIGIREIERMAADIVQMLSAAPTLYRDRLKKIALDADQLELTAGTVDRVPTEAVDRDLQILKLRDGAINADRLTFSNIEVVMTDPIEPIMKVTWLCPHCLTGTNWYFEPT